MARRWIFLGWSFNALFSVHGGSAMQFKEDCGSGSLVIVMTMPALLTLSASDHSQVPVRRAMSLPSSLLPNTSLPKAQFRAVVVCGFGSELYPLVEPVHAVVDGPGTNAANAADGDDDASNGGPEGTYTVDTDANAPPSGVAQPGASLRSGKQGQTKALLPVGGRRMVDWVLERIEEAGVFGEHRKQGFSAFATSGVRTGLNVLCHARQTYSSWLLNPSPHQWHITCELGGLHRQQARLPRQPKSSSRKCRTVLPDAASCKSCAGPQSPC